MNVEKALREMDSALAEIGAAALANKAVMTLLLARQPVTMENAERVSRVWLDPNSPATEPLVADISQQVGEMIKVAQEAFPDTAGTA